MLARWIPVHRARVARLGSGPGPAAGSPVPAERGFPVAVVAGHGLFALVTVVLVLLSALGVGKS
ncbi:hypothetical protein [Nonomuraea sp. NPDC049607]|uniref:hypothetical protein n=1 Tax=Nonomuraea sp. NPDC049607 TaxID=3154732 RepID=UPI0034436FC2